MSKLGQEIHWAPDFAAPADSIKDPYGIDRRGIVSWKNRRNGFFVAAIHFTADPSKRTKSWFQEATKLFKQYQIDREWNISFKSRAGNKAFPKLIENPQIYRIPNIPLDQVPSNWRIIAGLDYGSTNPTSIHFYGINRWRKIISLFEFYKPSNVREIASVLKGTHKGPNINGEHKDYRHPLWKRCEKLVVDGAIFNKTQDQGEEMRSIGDLLEEQGIYKMERATKDRPAGLARLHDLFESNIADPEQNPGMVFCERCVHQWVEFTSHIYAELPEHALLNKNIPEDIVPKDDHAYDETRYVGMSVAAPSEDLPIPEPEKGTLADVEKQWDLEDSMKTEVDFF